MSAEDDLRLYFDTFYGYEGAHGWLHVATGDPHLTDTGRIKHRNWREWAFELPDGDREPAIRAAFLDEATEHDVFVGPYLMSGRKRHKGFAPDVRFVHAEVDDDLDLEKVDAVDGFAVASGSPGHGHAYVPLSRSVEGWEHRMLCSALGEHLGAKDHKISDNDVLRAPGTSNHKPTVRGEPPTPVTWLVRPSGVLVAPEELAERLGVELIEVEEKVDRKAGGRRRGSFADEPTEQVDLTAWHMAAVRAALEKDTGDRSADIMRVIGACARSGLTLPQTRWAVRSREDLADKLDELTHDDVERCFNKATDSRDDDNEDDEGMDSDDQTGQEDGTGFFSKNGLLARDLADAVMRSVTCGFGYPDQRFYVYDGGVWLPDDGRIEGEITRLLGNRYRSAHTRSVLDLIRHSPNTVRITDNPLAEWVNVPNGMIAWKTGELLPHSPDQRSTVQLPVDYDPGAQCPLFEKFIAEVLPPDLYEPQDGDGLGFIWELIGYALYSGNPLHLAILLHGSGRNGKGTLIRVLKALLGSRNCSTVGLHQLVENRFRAATLFGKLANLAGDLDSKWLDNTALFKAITGGDTVQAEYKYGAAFDFAPWALPFYSINKAFGSADSSEGWVARWVVVPFPTSFIGREDRTLDAKLSSEAELQGVLRRGIEALPALMARGRFTEPDSLQEAKAAFVVASDAVRAWLDECCVLGLTEWTPRKDLYRAYGNHTVSDGSKMLSAREFYNRMEQVSGIRPAIRNGSRGFVGVRLAEGAAQGAGAEATNMQVGG